jgi:class 3 adenylate cyclase
MRPDQIQEAMNEYFDAMIEIVFRYGGTVDKLMGDGLMVFFGDPEPQQDHALLCVRAAIDMQLQVIAMRERWIEEGKFPIQIRVGINTGIVVVGNMGAARRLSYTALGAEVNLAQRLEANAPVGGILISETTYQEVKGKVPTRPLGQIQVKGYEYPINVHEVVLTD